MKRLKYIMLSISLMGLMSAEAQSLTQAKKWFNAGEYDKALPVFQKQLKNRPKRSDLNNYVGVCLFNMGSVEASLKYLKNAATKEAEANACLAIYNFDKMNYKEAEDYLTEFEELKNKDVNIPSLDRVKRGVTMLNNVEKIVIVDSLVVDKANFFKHYKLAPEAGSLNSTDILPYEKPDFSTTVFIPESGQRMIWAMEDSIGKTHLAETYKLFGGNWDKYTLLPSETLNGNGDVNYPFVMADGITLYYACNGDNSIGGYDIFKSRKDAITGNYLDPQNIGYPYNSPYDDYLLAIDEMTGAGWWATDRNQYQDKLTIYIFKPNNFRSNYDAETDNVYSLAAINSIKDTWTENDYNDFIQSIKENTMIEEQEEVDFIFHLNNDITYTKYSDFKSNEARSLMQERAKYINFLSDVKKQLSEMRKKFHKANATQKHKYSSEIVVLERTIIKNSAELQKIEKDIRVAELPKLKNRK